jgi:hypothetical protein
MSMKALDERHKKLAEMILLGVPKKQIADELGLNRGTIYKWMDDPMWQEYFNTLLESVEAARQKRLLPLVNAATEALLTALTNATNDMTSDDPAVKAAAPRIEALISAAKVVIELERVDHGQPSDIRESRAAEVKVSSASPAAQKFMGMLDEMAVTTSETEAPAAKEEEGS